MIVILVLVVRTPATVIVHEGHGERRKEVQYYCHTVQGATRDEVCHIVTYL